MIGDQNAKVGSQEIPGVTGKFGLGVQKCLCGGNDTFIITKKNSKKKIPL